MTFERDGMTALSDERIPSHRFAAVRMSDKTVSYQFCFSFYLNIECIFRYSCAFSCCLDGLKLDLVSRYLMHQLF